MKPEKKHPLKHIAFLLICLLFVSILADLLVSKYGLTTTNYTLSSDRLTGDFKVVQITDLHDSTFGKDNSRLIAAVAAAEPDLILITGDLVNAKTGTDTDIACDLIHNLSKIAPVYVSYGNQEDSMEQEYGIDFQTLYTEAGASAVLERTWTEVEVKGNSLRIGGIYGYCQPAAYACETHREEESAYLEDFQNTDLYTILMCHMPVSWIQSGSLYDWDIDAVFAGHAHGGQIRLPFIGGLYAPDQGFFPGRECGIYGTDEEIWSDIREWFVDYAESQGYDTGDHYLATDTYKPSYLILSRGLGNTDRVPRFNNIPEIVVVCFEGTGE